ncbi:ATP-dependent DNA helicase PIF1-like [Papaver somniferum]|uniref:ATP-dependent DNA helicase PIF1-like n=1 Tax=Papaver somniferum TaxID=3469 RepID=UPI000E6F8DAB|nr:ATP-dependent DNA helicase PIF1-like [Papaver somniferum]
MIVNSVIRGDKSIFFIDGPGGSGKTFLYRTILAKLRSEGRIAIATATSGIAATMMPGGRTTHSRFKIPVPAYSTSTCDIGAEDPLADLIRKADLIIWDEATMANRYAFEALDTTLRDLTKVALPFGGKILLLGGDFRQVLPVIEHGMRAQTINACLTNAKFWKDVKVIRLKENMLSSLKGMQSDKSYMSQRALITPKNDIVEKLNQKVINIFPGDEVVYHSFDMAKNDPNNLWTEDFLNTIAPGGLPPHRLILKIGAPIILLRNLDPSYGLCNSTRLHAEVCIETSLMRRSLPVVVQGSES